MSSVQQSMINLATNEMFVPLENVSVEALEMMKSDKFYGKLDSLAI